jgi:hypothetical protein
MLWTSHCQGKDETDALDGYHICQDKDETDALDSGHQICQGTDETDAPDIPFVKVSRNRLPGHQNPSRRLVKVKTRHVA